MEGSSLLDGRLVGQWRLPRCCGSCIAFETNLFRLREGDRSPAELPPISNNQQASFNGCEPEIGHRLAQQRWSESTLVLKLGTEGIKGVEEKESAEEVEESEESEEVNRVCPREPWSVHRWEKLLTSSTLHPVAPPRVVDYVAAAAADNTRRAYQSDLRMFLAWGAVLPSSPEAVAAYLVAHATTLSPVTLSRRLVAIARAHATLGHPNPCQADLVKTTLKGIWRVHGRPQRQVQPAIREDVLAMLPHMTSTRGIRDRALILIGFAGAFRRSELVALQFADVAFVKEGLTILIRRSKTDQIGEGRKIAIPFARSSACPVGALTNWLDYAGIQSGPLFRFVRKGGAIGTVALSAQSVAAIVKEYAHKAGLHAENYSGHSLRAGLITSAAKAGVSSWKIREQTGHKSDAMMHRYIRDTNIFENNAAGSVL
jgi:integrase